VGLVWTTVMSSHTSSLIIHVAITMVIIKHAWFHEEGGHETSFEVNIHVDRKHSTALDNYEYSHRHPDIR
jgi:hypothetical protein